MTEIQLIEQFKSHILAGKTIKELQDIYGWSRTKVTEFKKRHGLVGMSPNSKKLDRDLGSKICNVCRTLLPLSQFYSNGKTPTGLLKYKPSCIACENEARNSKFSELIYTYLDINGQDYSCVRCSYTGVFGSLDFHHKNPLEKDFNIGNVTKSISEEAFMNMVVPELDKCELLCPNCHRQEHLVMGLKGFDIVKSIEMDSPAMLKP